MNITKYDYKTDLKKMKHLISVRELPVTYLSQLPKNGFIVCDRDGGPIAAGFYRSVEGGYVIVDSYITDNTYAAEVRSEALSLLTTTLIKDCLIQGYSNILAITEIPTVVNIAVSNGFVIAPNHKLLIYQK